MKRNVYLNTIDLDNALSLFIDSFKYHRKIKKVIVTDALGYVTAKPIFAKISNPYYSAAAMDGILTSYELTKEANDKNHIRLKSCDFIYINTGQPIIDDYDCVIMIEDIIVDGDDVLIYKAATKWQHIRPVGEDVVANELLIPSNHKVRAVDIAALLGGGIKEIKVYEKINIGIIPSGTEIIEDSDQIEVGKIIDTNSHMFSNSILEMGHIPNRVKPVKDDYELLKNNIINAVKMNDIVLLSAGTSAGGKDFSKSIIEELGEVILHGVAIKPGKPVILGKIDNKPVIAIPGYPVSAYIVFENLVKKLIELMSNETSIEKQVVTAKLTKKIYSSLKHLEFVRVKLGYVNSEFKATPLNRGAGVLTSLVKADGILKIPKNSEGFDSGSIVEIELMRKLSDIKKTIVSIGSHDIVMDLLSDQLMKKANISISSSHVGSFSGIMAIRSNECHIAPVHILNELTGEYNTEIIKKYIKNDVILIKGIKREQGIYVQKGNPKNIKTIDDLNREDISFVNRQKGSGTRILLDYLINQKDMDKEKINGYYREMNTHTLIASSVASNTADCGIGIHSVAKSMNLDFIPLGYEDYDFIIPKDMVDNTKIESFIEVLKSKEFKDTLIDYGGYQISEIKMIEVK